MENRITSNGARFEIKIEKETSSLYNYKILNIMRGFFNE